MLILDTEADEHRASTANNQTSNSFHLNVSLLTVECYVRSWSMFTILVFALVKFVSLVHLHCLMTLC